MSPVSDPKTGRAFEIVGSTLAGWLDPAVAIAASRAGATGLLNLEHTTDLDAARSALTRLATFGRGSLGVKVRAGSAAAAELVPALPPAITLVVVAGPDAAGLGPAIALARAGGRRVLAECTSVDEARAAVAGGADGVIAKGHEAAGHVGEETTFILLQRLRTEIDRPVLAYGGIGLHSAAAGYVAGCSGLVVDVQLALARESAVPSRLRAILERMEGDETLCLGAELGDLYRIYQRPGMAAAEALQQLESSLVAEATAASEAGFTPAERAGGRGGFEVERSETSADPAYTTRRASIAPRILGGAPLAPPSSMTTPWREALQARVGWEHPETQLYPLGQDGAFAARLARRFHTVAGILDALRAAVVEHVTLARAQRALDRGAALARSHGTEYPILQGPMTRVSDTAAFAEAVARGGALPFLALALLRGPQVRALLQETGERLGDRPWGVGILGFVPLELRQEQLEVIHDFRPRFAIIAGGRPDQAARLEANGIATYLHVPAPGLLRMFLEDGARRFIFEGRECGGHVGPRTSFVLWQTMIDTLLDALDAGIPADGLHVVFAGGVHDDRSAAMVAAMAAPLVERGARIGVLLGTGYLFTEEAVAAGAIVEGFQRAALACRHTVLLETGPGHSTRCVDTPFYETFRQAKRRLVGEGRPPEDIRGELENLNLGRLRIASKGIVRDEDASGPRYVGVEAERQRQEGMFMIGQLAALRKSVCRISDLHETVSVGSTRLLDGMAVPAGPARRAVTGAPHPTDVAIIGLGCLLPRAADVQTFWANVLNKVDAITEVPKDRFDIDLYFDKDRKARDKVYSRWGGFLDDVPFDPMRYGIPPAALPSIDSLQLLSLEAARQALADAGYLDREFPRERTSVILGLSGGLGDLGLSYGIRSNLPAILGSAAPEVLDRLPEWTEDSFAGILLNVAAGRVANRFDLGGVNYTVDAACASSLAAVYLAVSELESGTSDMVIVGGVDTVQSPFGFLCFSKSQALSPRGRCRTFDAGADGITISEGLTMLVLKRRAEAERDGDRIYAVIKGVAGSSDGRGRSLTAPRPEGQTLALERAYAKAGISPATVGLIEAHGTGTVAGDAAEVAALSEVFQSAGAERASCAIGSVKSMLGHTKSAAGVTGMMKVALALHHKVLPPTLHVETPNPKLSEADSPFFVNTEPLPWMRTIAEPATPRRAGVSSFGFGGTNFHAVLEEHVDDYAHPIDRKTSGVWPGELFVWSGGSPAGLEATLDKFQASLDMEPRPALRALAATVCSAIAANGAAREDALRLAIVAADHADLRAKLGGARDALRAGRTQLLDRKGVYLGGGAPAAGKLAFLFPGQGSQAPHMLRDLALHFPHLRLACERADRALAGRLPQRLSAYIYPPPAFTAAEQDARMQAITDTVVAQPALGAVELGVLDLLRDLGVEPDMVAGHSYGEYVALAAAGVLSPDALFGISEARGRVIKESVGETPGTMAAVSAPADKVAEALRDVPGVWLANFNAPRQTIIAGAPADVEGAIGTLASSGLRAKPIPVACAFHSPLMERARVRLSDELARLELKSPRIPVFSNTVAGPYPDDPSAVAALLSEHLVRPVRFVDEIQAMYARGARLFVEVGPKSVLTSLVRQILEQPDAAAINLDASDRNGLVQLLHALGQLAAAGVKVKLERLFAGRPVDEVKPEKAGETRAKAPAWVVSGAGARPAGQPAARRAPPAPVAVSAASVTAAVPVAAPVPPVPVTVALPASASVAVPPALNGGHTAPAPMPVSSADAIVLQFQNLMSQFLQTQATVMSAYLQGGLAGEGAVADAPVVALPALSLPVVPAPVSVVAAAPPVAVAPSAPRAPSRRDVAAELLGIVSERTGYPLDMLNPELNLEADLGIDSIKRVEILSAFQRQCSGEEQTRVQQAMERVTAEKTLNGMVRVLEEAVGAEMASPVAAPPAASAPVPAAPGARDIPSELLHLVGERTGYPVEMLGLELGLEADLGIDSIKRVEILSAFQRGQSAEDQARVSGVMERLTSRKTLREVIATLEEALAATPAAATSPAAASAAAPVEDVPRLTMRAVDAPLETSRGRTYSGRVWLVTDDEGGLAEAVAGRLVQIGERPVLLRQRAALAEAGPDRFDADLTRPEQIAAVLDRVRARHGAPRALLHLLPLKAAPDFDRLTIDGWRDQVQTDIKTLYGLIRAAADDLAAAGRGGGAMVVAATGLGASLAGGPPAASPTHAGVAALLKTVAAEMPEVGCRAVHLDPSARAEERTAQLLAEVGTVEGPVEVGYGAGRRVTVVPRLAPLANGSNGANGADIASDWVFLITGGARGITAEIAAYLASVFKPTLVLAGLSPLPEDEGPATAAIDDPQLLRAALTTAMRAANPALKPSEVEAAWQRVLRNREIRRNLAALRKSGARVEYQPVDVRDEAAFGALIDGIYRTHGRLDAVIHGAGIIEDKLLRDKTAESFDRVVHTKTDSAFTLVRRLRPEGLKLLIFMSSVTATFGNRGQADYGAANGVLNALAALLASRWPARVRALNWGPWDKAGMVSEQVKRQFASRGIQVIPASAGVAAAAREIKAHDSEPVVVVGGGPWVADAARPLPVEVPA
jgi:acyl transferase domain-containing protein/NAD(P)H-dependent flavin oxidoreductase YrpB (nitropropane dioxygenase family)/NADP-dependent 3-hydroxy acid dehydrogenase YdfG